jgi:hypothetical protein
MLQISRLESPMSKLEWVYTCCTQAIPIEVSEFWKDVEIPSKKLSIDTDQLQGILIYVVSRMKYPQILTEVHLIEKFLPKGVKKSARAMYLEMIGAACTYLLELEIDKYLDTKVDELRSGSIITLENEGNLRYNESFAFTDLPGKSSLPKQHAMP